MGDTGGDAREARSAGGEDDGGAGGAAKGFGGGGIRGVAGLGEGLAGDGQQARAAGGKGTGRCCGVAAMMPMVSGAERRAAKSMPAVTASSEAFVRAEGGAAFVCVREYET
jgi:hypothetical protein